MKINSNLCPECGGYSLSTYQRGEIACESCGLVINENIIDIAHDDVRCFDNEQKEKREHTGSPMNALVPNIALSTVIDSRNIKSTELKRAVKWNSHLSWEKRNLVEAITELKRIGTNLNFPYRVKEAAVSFYKEVFKKGLIRGRSIRGIMAACAYFECRKEEVPITFQEILDESSIDAQVIKRCYKLLIDKFKLKPEMIDPISLIPKYCAELHLDMEIEHATIRFLKAHFEKKDFCGRNPKGITGGAIYLVAKLKNKKVSQQDISKVVGVTEVTIRSRYKELLSKMSIF